METTISQSKSSAKASPRAGALVYIFLIVGVFVAITLVFLFFPRSTYSELEKRELAVPPEFSVESLFSSEYTAAVSHWFNDSEPYRDELMALSMKTRALMRLQVGGEEAISFHAPDPEPAVETTAADDAATPEAEAVAEDFVAPDGVAKISHNGIVVVGTGSNVRALMAYGGSRGGESHARMANRYAAELPGVKVYTMPIPLASEFYLPEKAKSISRSQWATIESVRDHLDGVVFVNGYDALKAHAAEDIYLRTDHHWAPLGAFYAAERFAKTAGVPFRQLSDGYQQKVIHNFVGSMYGYSKDIAVKNAPEDFVYYQPTGVEYSTTFRTYSVNDRFKVTAESRPVKGAFFKHFKDGSGAAYCTFMGSDQLLVKVETGTKNGRRLAVVKDSYGNAVPGYLFYSFEEIHVIDFRYFPHNIKEYCAANNITDLLFVLNIFNTYSSSTSKACERFLTQAEGAFAAPTPKAPADSARASESTDPAQVPATAPAPASSAPEAIPAAVIPAAEPTVHSASEPESSEPSEPSEPSVAEPEEPAPSATVAEPRPAAEPE